MDHERERMKVEEAGGLAGLLWHPNAVAQSVHTGWWLAWVATLDWLAECEAWVTSAGEIAAWWRERDRLQRGGA